MATNKESEVCTFNHYAESKLDIIELARAMYGRAPTKREIDRIVDTLFMARTEMCVLGKSDDIGYWKEEYPIFILLNVLKEVPSAEMGCLAADTYDSCVADCLVQVEQPLCGEKIIGPSWFFRICYAIASSAGGSVRPLFAAIYRGKQRPGNRGDAMFVVEDAADDGSVNRMLELMEDIGLVSGVMRLNSRQQKIFGFDGYGFRENIHLWPNIITIQ